LATGSVIANSVLSKYSPLSINSVATGGSDNFVRFVLQFALRNMADSRTQNGSSSRQKVMMQRVGTEDV
jgi:hypothetical protein